VGQNKFQSTLPVKGATAPPMFLLTEIPFQSTLPVKGATLRRSMLRPVLHVSIHAPGEGSDDAFPKTAEEFEEFQSTLPVKGATQRGPSGIRLRLFQSTLPVKGATFHHPHRGWHPPGFNPRSR